MFHPRRLLLIARLPHKVCVTHLLQRDPNAALALCVPLISAARPPRVGVFLSRTPPFPSPPLPWCAPHEHSSRLASQLLVCMDELARWRSAGLGGAPAAGARAAAGAAGSSNGGGGDERGRTPTLAAGTLAGRQLGGGGSANVMVLAATNAPEAVDAAFLRPGRFDEVRRGGGHGRGRAREGLPEARYSWCGRWPSFALAVCAHVSGPHE